MVSVVCAEVGIELYEPRKATDPDKKRGRLLFCFGVALLLMLLGMPWSDMVKGQRLFRV